MDQNKLKSRANGNYKNKRKPLITLEVAGGTNS